MSVILMSGKKSAQKFKGTPNKDKDKKTIEKLSTVATVNSYLPSDSVDVWNCVVGGSPVSIALCKDNFEIWCNDVLINSIETLDATETKMDFVMMSHKMRITVSFDKNTKHPISVLTIDGEIIPHAAPIIPSANSHPTTEKKLNNQHHPNE